MRVERETNLFRQRQCLAPIILVALVACGGAETDGNNFDNALARRETPSVPLVLLPTPAETETPEAPTKVAPTKTKTPIPKPTITRPPPTRPPTRTQTPNPDACLSGPIGPGSADAEAINWKDGWSSNTLDEEGYEWLKGKFGGVNVGNGIIQVLVDPTNNKIEDAKCYSIVPGDQPVEFYYTKYFARDGTLQNPEIGGQFFFVKGTQETKTTIEQKIKEGNIFAISRKKGPSGYTYIISIQR